MTVVAVLASAPVPPVARAKRVLVLLDILSGAVPLPVGASVVDAVPRRGQGLSSCPATPFRLEAGVVASVGGPASPIALSPSVATGAFAFVGLPPLEGPVGVVGRQIRPASLISVGPVEMVVAASFL